MRKREISELYIHKVYSKQKFTVKIMMVLGTDERVCIFYETIALS